MLNKNSQGDKKLLSNFIDVVPIEDTFFVELDKPQQIKLTGEIIKLNYKHLSPFNGGDLLFFQTKKRLYIWFIKYPLPERKKVFIPEGYLILKRIKNYQQAIGIYEKDSLACLFVVKDGDFLSQVTISKSFLKEKIELLKREYSLHSPQIITVTKDDLKRDVKDIFLFANFSFRKEEFYNLFLDYLTIPLTIIFVLLTAYNIGLKSYLTNIKEDRQIQLYNLKEQNKDIKKLIYQMREKLNFWQEFASTELKYADFNYMLNCFLKVVKKNQGYVNYFEMNENMISTWVGVKAGDNSIINDLLQTGLFESVKVISSSKDRKRQGYDLLNIEMFLKGRTNE
jgi:hypothetical protein